MSSQKLDSSFDRLLEASTLPPDDAIRREVERAVVASRTTDAAQWNELLKEAQTLREDLSGVPVPVDLQARLLAIPDTDSDDELDSGKEFVPAAIPDSSKTENRLGSRMVWAVSAVAVIVAGLLLLQPRERDSRLETVVLLAVNNHLKHIDEQHLSVETGDANELASVLSHELPFEIAVPVMKTDFQLRGGRKCTLGAHPAALLLWKCEDEEYSVFQFRRHDLGISTVAKPRYIQLHEPAAGKSGAAWVWTRGDYGFVLVGNPRSPLRQLSPFD